MYGIFIIDVSKRYFFGSRLSSFVFIDVFEKLEKKWLVVEFLEKFFSKISLNFGISFLGIEGSE